MKRFLSLLLVFMTVVSLTGVAFSKESKAEYVAVEDEDITATDPANDPLLQKDHPDPVQQEQSPMAIFEVQFMQEDTLLHTVKVLEGNTVAISDIPRLQLGKNAIAAWKYTENDEEVFASAEDLCHIKIKKDYTFALTTLEEVEEHQAEDVAEEFEAHTPLLKGLPLPAPEEDTPLYLYYLKDEPQIKFAPTADELSQGVKTTLEDGGKLYGKEVFGGTYDGEITEWRLYVPESDSH